MYRDVQEYTSLKISISQKNYVENPFLKLLRSGGKEYIIVYIYIYIYIYIQYIYVCIIIFLLLFQVTLNIVNIVIIYFLVWFTLNQINFHQSVQTMHFNKQMNGIFIY